MTQMTEQEIAKELLKPYFDDPTLCSMGLENRCLYKGPNGRMCAFARACTPEGRELLQELVGARAELNFHGDEILQDKYRHIEDRDFWSSIQYCHDLLARGEVQDANLDYEELTGEEIK